MIIQIWIFSSLVGGFLAGWVIGKYGHHSKVPKLDGSKLVAMHIASSNNRTFKA